MKKLNGKTLAELALIGLMAGGVSLTGCKKSTGSDEKTDPLAKFKSECEESGGTYKAIASCTGSGECAGKSYDTATGKETTHDCKGQNTCAGAQCLDA